MSALFLFPFRLGLRSFPFLFQPGVLFPLLGFPLGSLLLLLQPGLFFLVGRGSSEKGSERGRALVVVPIMVLEEPDEIGRMGRMAITRLGQTTRPRMILDRVRVTVMLLLLLLLRHRRGTPIILNGTGRAGQVDAGLRRARDDRPEPSQTIHRRGRLTHRRPIPGRVGRVRRRPLSTGQGEEITST